MNITTREFANLTKEYIDSKIHLTNNKELTEKFISFSVIEEYQKPKTTIFNNNVDYTDSCIEQKKVYKTLTKFNANMFEFYICGYYTDCGYGFEGWDIKYGFEKHNVTHKYQNIMLRNYGLEYATRLRKYAFGKMTTALLRNNKADFSFWRKSYYKADKVLEKNNQPEM